jgi:hypothetical protein
MVPLWPSAVTNFSNVTWSSDVWSTPARSSLLTQVRFIEWNVYWAALDDAAGRTAIVRALDSVLAVDFAAIIEAEGDTPGGALHNWTAPSRMLSTLTSLTHRSRFETIALFYDASRWRLGYQAGGEFTPGRPWLLASFTARASPAADARATSTPLWIMAVHFPHFLDTTISPGTSIASAFDAAPGLTPTSDLIVAGDFNEFEWEDNPCPAPIYPTDCRAQAAARMAPLWSGWLRGAARDVVPNHTVTCCTKWASADRHTTTYEEWRFEYDHVFVSGAQLATNATHAASLLPYAYPGTAAKCADAACTGEDPPQNVTARHQGSWHRGWLVELKGLP